MRCIYLVDVELLILFKEAQYVSSLMLFGVIVMQNLHSKST